jgi:hypothetical protein
MANQEPSEYVTLVSHDGFKFIVLRECANVSGALRRMLDPRSELVVPQRSTDQDTDFSSGGFLEARNNRVVLENIR